MYSKIVQLFLPYLDITFDEYTSDRFNRSEIYTTIQNYLSDRSSTDAKSMKADYIKDSKSLLLSLGDNEEVLDEYNGVKVFWSSSKEATNRPSLPFYPASGDKRYYKLIFHNRDRKFILNTYLPYVLEEGEAISIRKRTRKLLTNAGSDGSDWMGDRDTMWSHIEFKHPARFDNLAMDETKKQMIIDDLLWFRSSKDYYSQIAKPWKRGYLLYGPPGTGKSTLVAAMANLLDYDIYDLELTAVKDNMQLQKLLTETTGKSIILIEDIDCSLDLTGQRKSKKDGNDEEEKDPVKKLLKKDGESEKKGSEVTLSGLLNFIDGIWSSCGEERIIVFTTNYIDKLDPALIRRGRMDVQIELSYCCFEAFKCLAKNYLGVESHPLFESIGRLLQETEKRPLQMSRNV
ncbi:hypothetical protein RND81_13G080500 [Saponaria officinalis]|uniref:AAA+ ATPase domain-containing protein n=1 Tax=Saponaria officinalis TaxID=3572 RepID=A0AAW1GV48_SAPOF